MDECITYLAGLEQLSGKEKMLLWELAGRHGELGRLTRLDVQDIIGRQLRHWRGYGLAEELEAQKAQSFARTRGWKRVCLHDPGYPVLLRSIGDPPFVLWHLGELPGPSTLLLAVVGTRRPSEDARFAAWELGLACADHRVGLVSGLAYGIDGSAHQGCVQGRGVSVAVLPGSLDSLSPRGHRDLAQGIFRAGGCLVSEYGPGTQPAAWRFIARNRIIAGLVPAIVVVEAPLRSGALITADQGLDEGRDIWVHPSGCNTSRGMGTLRLMNEGARVFAGMEGIVEEYGKHN